MEWSGVLTGLAVGLAAGYMLACLMGLAKETDRQAEVDFWRHKSRELEERKGQ